MIDKAVEEALLDIHARRGDDRRDVTFRSWAPHGLRKTRQRVFVSSGVGGCQEYVAKIPLDAADRMVEREWEVLSGLTVRLPRRPLPLQSLGAGFVMTYVPAEDFADTLSRAPSDAWGRILSDAMAFASVLHLAGGVPRTAPAEAAALYVPDLSSLSSRSQAAVVRAAVGPTHGDLAVWNLRSGQDGALSMIDWEDYQPVGVPALDVLNVLFTAALVAFPDYVEQGYGWLYDRVFHQANFYRFAADRALARYAGLTGTTTDDLVNLTPLFCHWMIRRIQLQGRPTEHLFYRTFADRFEAEPIGWSAVAAS